MTEAPTWKPTVTSGCRAQLRALTLEALIEWADKDDAMTAELVKRITALNTALMKEQKAHARLRKAVDRALDQLAKTPPDKSTYEEPDHA